MKIGILTFHRALNYGAVLQCYALQQIIKRKGAEAIVINYKQPYIDKICKVINLKALFSCCIHLRYRSVYQMLLSIPSRAITKYYFRSFVRRYICLSKECTQDNIPSNFDAYIIGSDQVWTNQHTKGFDLIFWGCFRHENAKLYSYAASTDIGSLTKMGVEKMSSLLGRFSGISCRENHVANYISRKTKLSTRVDIDPTLVADFDVWEKIINKKWSTKKYIVLHEARFIKGNKNCLLNKAKDLATRNSLELIVLSDLHYKPADFVSAIKYAKCVITSSFHAVAFSVIFNRPLIAVKLNDGHDDRYIDLLSSIEANSLIKELWEDFDISQQFDYTNSNNLLAEKRMASLDYISSIIN